MTDLITALDYKTYVGINNATKDVQIEQLVTSLSALVKKYCGLSFIDFFSSAKTEYFDIYYNGVSEVYLDELPIIDITSVEERESQSVPYTTLETAGNGGFYDYLTDTELGIIKRTSETASKGFKKGPASVKVVYTAGYETVPEDIKIALFDLVTYYLKDEHKERRSVVNSSINNQGTSSADNSTNFPDHITRVLDLYRAY